MARGSVEAFAAVIAIFAAGALTTVFVPIPSDRLFDNAAQIGATLLIAFAVEVTWLVKVSDREGAKREEWIGFVSCLGVVGFSGIATSLALVEHLGAGHDNWLDRLGFAWVLASQLILGIVVALQPATAYAWRQAGNLD